MKQKLGRKLLSFLLTLAMVVGLLPGVGLTAYAEDTPIIELAQNLAARGESQRLIWYVGWDLWSSSETLYLRVNSGDWIAYDETALDNAQLKGKEVGDYTVYYYVGTTPPSSGEQGTVAGTVTITEFVPVTNVTLDKTNSSIAVGESVALTAAVKPDDATDRWAKWSVGGEGANAVKLYWDQNCEYEVREFDSGNTVFATGISAGEATVTASTIDGSKSASCVVTVTPRVPISYLDWDDSGKNLVLKESDNGCKDYTVLNGNPYIYDSLGEGWYVVKGADETISTSGYFEVGGNAHLILCDSAKLTINTNIFIKDGCSLTIHSQSLGENMGQLIVNSANYSDGIFSYVDTSVTINGGSVSVTAKKNGIWAGDSNVQGKIGTGHIMINGGTVTATGGEHGLRARTGVTINGGTVTAKSTDRSSRAIYCDNGDVTINGGVVTATGNGEESAGIGANQKVAINGGIVTAYGEEKGIDSGSGITVAKSLSVLAGDNADNAVDVTGTYPSNSGCKWVYTSPAPAASVIIGSESIICDDWSQALTKWKEAGSGATLKLLRNVDLDSAIAVSGTKTLDLNGKTIDRGLANSNPTSGGYVIFVNGDLTLMDSSTDGTGRITGGNNSAQNSMPGGGIHIKSGSLTMTGGSITGNATSANGGGVYVAGNSHFTMTGGTISNNSAGYGGGVYLTGGNSSQFTMSGGTISENSASTSGGGVYIQGGAFNLSGSPVITGNLGANNAASNVYLPNTTTKININGQLDNSAAVGVTMQRAGVFTSGGIAKDYAANFSSDNSTYSVLVNGDELKLGIHSFSVTITAGDHMTKTEDSGEASQTDLSGAMTDVVYTANDGYYFPEDYAVTAVNGISVTRNSYTQITVSGTPTADAAIALTAPTAKKVPTTDDFLYSGPGFFPTYDGTAKTATVVPKEGVTGMGNVTVKYYSGVDWDEAKDNEVQSPINAGVYYVGITVAEGDNYSAVSDVLHDSSWKFTIRKATPIATYFTYSAPSDLTYDGTAKTATVEPNVGITGMGNVTVKYYSDQRCTTEVTPTNVGTYYVGIILSEGNNYRDASSALHNDDWRFTITKAAETAPAADTTNLIINYSEETISANGGYEVAADNNGTSITNFSAILENGTPTVYIRKTASDNNHDPSAWVAVTLAARPDAPNGLSTENASNGGTADGKIKGTTAAMEYKQKDSESEWTTAMAGETAVVPGTYIVRVKATDAAPHGKATEATVGSNYKALDDSTTVTIKKGGSELSGVPVVDDVLTVSCEASDVTYQWYRGDEAISEASGTSYTVTKNDVGKAIKVVATQTKDSNGQEITGTKPTKDSAATSAVVKKTPETLSTDDAKTKAGINYQTEQAAPDSGYEVSTDGTNKTESPISLTGIIDSESPKIYVRTAENDDTAAGAWVEVTIVARPDEPTGLTTESANTDTSQDGKIKGTTGDMEYKLKGSEGAWTTATAGETLVASGTYLIRTKASSDKPAGKTAEVAVGSKEIILTDAQKPTAKTNLVFTGSKQALVNEPAENLPEGAKEIQYALGTKDAAIQPYTTAIPTTTEAGTYYVWYKAVAKDDNYVDSTPVCVEVTIGAAQADGGSTAKPLTYDGNAQALVVPGEVIGGKLFYALGSDNVTAPVDGWSETVPTAAEPGTYYVWYKVEGDGNHNGTAPACVVVTIEKPYNPAEYSDFTLLATLKTSGKKALKLSWTAVEGAEGYDVFFGRSSEAAAPYLTSVNAQTFTVKKLTQGIGYRASVQAWRTVNGQKTYIGQPSPDAFAITGGKTAVNFTNPKKISVKKKKIALNVGGTKAIKASVKKAVAGRKYLNKVAKVRYFSSDRRVATVDAKGNITAVGAGTCKVFAVAANGLRVGVNVTVK